jgi:sugar lactone lactonase YvrE
MSDRRATEFTIAATSIAGRLSLLAALAGAVWLVVQTPYFPAVSAALHGHDDPDDRYIERIGSAAVVYDARAYRVLECDTRPCDQLDDSGLDYNVRIEVLDSGLIDGRGIAYDPDKARLIVADAWEGLYGYWPDLPQVKPDRLPWIRVCPGGRCHDVDHRGLAYDPDTTRIVVTDYHQHRLALRLQSGEFDRSIGGSRLIDGVTDVVLAERGAFFVSATGETSMTNSARQAAGTVYHVTESDAQPIVTGLQRPIGLAFSPCQQRLYVADSSGDGLTLYFFTQDSHSQWQRAGVLATLSGDRDAPPAPLSGMAVAVCRPPSPALGAISAGGELFVAGPGGLYVFHPDGTLLAKFVLGERVTGLAWDEWTARRHDVSEPVIHQLYMTVGHRIARLHTIVGPEPLATRRPRPTPLAIGAAAVSVSPGASPLEVGRPPANPGPPTRKDQAPR